MNRLAGGLSKHLDNQDAAALIAVVAVAAIPLATAFGSSFVVAALGCQLDEGDIRPGVVLGENPGYALSVVNDIGLLLAIPFVPVAAIAFLIWLVAAVIACVRYWSAKRWAHKTP